MQIGDSIKVYLPGESPWATVVSIHSDGRVAARIDNHPVSDLQGYKFGDVATFEKNAEFETWELAPLDKQLPALKPVA